MLSGSVLHIDIFGPEATPLDMSDGEPIDLLDVNGIASLNGVIDLDFEDGFMPEFGDIFTLVKADDFVIGPNFGLSDGFLRIVPNGPGMGYSLQAIVPEPGTVAMWSLLALAAGGFAARMRGRRRK